MNDDGPCTAAVRIGKTPAYDLFSRRGALASQPGCGCVCHRVPGVKHAVACCDAPPADDADSVA